MIVNFLEGEGSKKAFSTNVASYQNNADNNHTPAKTDSQSGVPVACHIVLQSVSIT